MNEIRGMSLEQLAVQCQVSQPTVIRMLKALGFRGYREFCYALVEELARETDGNHAGVMYGYSLSGTEKLEELPGKVLSTTSRAMEETLKNLSVKTYRSILDILNRARRIDIYSVENSNVTAQDLLTKLLYLGLNCRHLDDSYHQRICAANLTPEDAAIGISYSGCSKDTVEAVKTARRQGASTIVITNFKNSPIAAFADYLICTSQDQFFYGDSIFSRTTQLMVVDMIYMGLILSDYDHYITQLNQSSRIVRDKDYPSFEKKKR